MPLILLYKNLFFLYKINQVKISKVAGNSSSPLPKDILGWIDATTPYQVIVQHCYQKNGQPLLNHKGDLFRIKVTIATVQLVGNTLDFSFKSL